MREELREKMAGEVTLSETPGATIRKWREEFGVAQQELAEQLEFSPSVISDYESGRRRSPGVQTVRKIVDGLLDIDEKRGSKVIKRFTFGEKSEAILSMSEFPVGLSKKDLIEQIDGKVVCKVEPAGEVYGYTVLDSIRAITTFDSSDYLKVYGWSTQRAMIFADIKYGRSPMIAIRAHPLKPGLVIYHSPENIDNLALHLAELERIPLVVTNMDLPMLIGRLEGLAHNMEP